MNSHGRTRRRAYNTIVNRYHLKAVAAAAAASLAFSMNPVIARAQSAGSMTVPVTSSPVVHVQLRSGTVVIRTWDQAQIQVVSSDAVDVRHFDPDAVERALGNGDIPIFSTTIVSSQGPLLLPAEAFSVGAIGGGHDGVVIRGGLGGNLVITVPKTTAFIWAMLGHGVMELHDYRGGAFVARVHTGLIRLDNVGGNGYVEAARGRISMTGSAVNRLRARTAIGNILFENCNARQIEVSSIEGSIAYDDGTFAPGLARFESQNGNVAIGVAGGALQIGAHSQSGKVYEQLRDARISGSPADAQISIGSGGPVVTASSGTGNVYLYSGAFKGQRFPQQWQPVGRIVKLRKTPLQQKFPHRGHI